jgi:phosphomannomutase
MCAPHKGDEELDAARVVGELCPELPAQEALLGLGLDGDGDRDAGEADEAAQFADGDRGGPP